MSWLTMPKGARDTMLRSIDPKVRTALAASCGGRVYLVWEKHWVGDYSTAVKDAIDVGWGYATGDESSMFRKARLTDQLRPLVEYLNEDGIEILASAVTVSLRVLESITAEEAESALALYRALGSALFVAKLAGSISKAGAEEGQKEEEDWQDAALEVARTWRGPPTKTMFDGIGSTPPKWWVTYEVGPNYY